MSFPPPSPKQARLLWWSLTALAVGVLLALLGVLLWGLARLIGLLSPVLWPLAIAGVLAYVLDPLVDFLVSKKFRRTRAILLVFSTGLLLAAGLLASVVPQLVNETGELAAKIPKYSEHLQEKAKAWITQPSPGLKKVLSILRPASSSTNAPAGTNVTVVVDPANPAARESELEKIIPEAITSISESVRGALPAIGKWMKAQFSRAAAWVGGLLALALVPVYAFYFLQEKRGIQSKWTDYLPLQNSKVKEELVFVLTAVNDYLIAFFRGQLLVAACDGVLYTIGFVAIGLNYALLLGVMATLLTMIPFLGAMITCATVLLLATVQFQDWQHPLLVLGVFAIVQAIEGLVISPKIMGERVGLHPLAIIIAVMVGTTLLGGILGGVLAIPLAAALRVVMFRYVWKKR